MNYTLWYYAWNSDFSKLVQKHDIFTGKRSACYKIRSYKAFKNQYKVLKSRFD